MDGAFIYLVDTELNLAGEPPAVGCFDNCIDLEPGIVPVLEHRCACGLGVDPQVANDQGLIEETEQV